jgi:hypothetical protein
MGAGEMTPANDVNGSPEGQLSELPFYVELLGTELMHRLSKDLLVTISEGFVKVRCMEAALSLGWTIQEGAGVSGKVRVADYASFANGRVSWVRGMKRLSLQYGSADVAVVDPIEIFVEIKCRPDRGTKSQAQFSEMDADVARVASTPNCIFISLFDEKVYRSFSNSKVESRGRRSLLHGWFHECFPTSTDISEEAWTNRIVDRGGVGLALQFRRFRSGGGDEITMVLGRHAGFPPISDPDGLARMSA